MVKVMKKSSPREPTFLTWPSNTSEIDIQMTINKIVVRLRRGVLKRSRIE